MRYEKQVMENKKGKLTFLVLAMIIMTDVIESFAELFWKKGTLATGIDSVTIENFIEFITKLTASSGFLAGVALYIINFFLWITVLSKVDLSVAFPTGSTSYIIVAVLSMVFLGEQISPYRWSGIVLIIIGIWYISRSSHEERATL
jgi:drug/metabolite transporter (DMT)-like permease